MYCNKNGNFQHPGRKWRAIQVLMFKLNFLRPDTNKKALEIRDTIRSSGAAVSTAELVSLFREQIFTTLCYCKLRGIAGCYNYCRWIGTKLSTNCFLFIVCLKFRAVFEPVQKARCGAGTVNYLPPEDEKRTVGSAAKSIH